MRVLLWAPMGAGLHYDGAGTNAYHLYGAMPAGACSVTLVHGCAEQARLEVFCEQIFLGSLKRRAIVAQSQFLWHAKQWLSENHKQFDVFHGLHVFESTLLPALWAQRLGLPAVIKPANHRIGLSDVSRAASLLLIPQLRRKILRELSGLVAISSHIHTELTGYGIRPERIHKIPNGVDTRRFHPIPAANKNSLRKELKLNRQFVILFVGEISDRKRPHWILPGLKRLVDEGVDAELVLVGPVKDQACWSKLRQQAQSLHLVDRINWHGFVTEVERYYQMADVFVLPSQNEGMPNAMLEAMASGLPAICSPISGCSDVLGDGSCGRLVGSIDSLSDTLIEYAQNRDALRHIAQAARDRMERQFALPIVAEQYLALFRQISRNVSANTHE